MTDQLISKTTNKGAYQHLGRVAVGGSSNIAAYNAGGQGQGAIGASSYLERRWTMFPWFQQSPVFDRLMGKTMTAEMEGFGGRPLLGTWLTRVRVCVVRRGGDQQLLGATENQYSATQSCSSMNSPEQNHQYQLRHLKPPAKNENAKPLLEDLHKFLWKNFSK